MEDNILKGKGEQVESSKDGQYTVTLPCDPKDLNEFISGLFGKPQTIEKVFYGTFELTREYIANTFRLVDQRIHQQNEAVLIQFTVKVFYDDDSSVLFESLNDFIHYNEIKPLKSDSVNLCWTYLIRFQKKKIPEKQQIDLTFRASSGSNRNKMIGQILIEDGVIISRHKVLDGPFGTSLRISHTERTWGVDIESLLTGHVKTLMITQNKLSKFVWRNSGRIGIAAAILFFLGALIGASITIQRFTESYIAEVAALGQKASQQVDLLLAKTDFIINIITKGVWPLFIIKILGYIRISFIVAIIIGFLIEAKADNAPKSFVLLTKASEEFRNKIRNERKRDWVMFIISVIMSTITSLFANILFANYVSKM